MERQKESSEKQKSLWVSLTGYRTLLILKALLEKDRTVDELVECLKADKITDKSVSKDTVRLTILTLKQAGCEISRPTKTNKFHYQLLSHPFKLNITDGEMKALIKLRDILIENYDWKKVLKINDLYEKIFSLSFDEEKFEFIKNSNSLATIDKNIIVELTNSKIINRKIQIVYNSPKSGVEDLDVIPRKISYQNGKLYLLCYIFKYEKTSILNFERILKINNINLFDEFDGDYAYEVIYKLKNYSAKYFEPKEFEEVIEKSENEITVKANVINEFLFVQRLLLFGSDFSIVLPYFFKEKLLDKLKLIKRGYENEK